MPVETAPHRELEDALRRVVELEAALTTTTETLSKTSAALATVTAERDKIRHAYEQLKGQLELLRRRIFLAKAERIDTQQLEIEFAETQAKLVQLAKELGADDLIEGVSDNDNDTSGSDDGRPARTKKSKGRRDIRLLDIPEERVELLDPALEGKAERIGFEESCLLGHRRGGPVRIVMARATYKVTADDETTEFVMVDKPKEIYERGILAPSFIAHLLTKKFRWACPSTAWPSSSRPKGSLSMTARCAGTPSTSGRRSAASSMRLKAPEVRTVASCGDALCTRCAADEWTDGGAPYRARGNRTRRCIDASKTRGATRERYQTPPTLPPDGGQDVPAGPDEARLQADRR